MARNVQVCSGIDRMKQSITVKSLRRANRSKRCWPLDHLHVRQINRGVEHVVIECTFTPISTVCFFNPSVYVGLAFCVYKYVARQSERDNR